MVNPQAAKTTKQRTRFERWLATTSWNSIHSPVAVTRREDHCYFYAHVELAWQAFQAAERQFKPKGFVVHAVMAEPELSWTKPTGTRCVKLYRRIK